MGQQLVKRAAHCAQFVVAVNAGAAGQVALFADLGHGAHQLMHRVGQRPFDGKCQPAQQQREHGDLADKHQRIVAERSVEVVQIQARGDNPAPGRKAFGIGQLGHRLILARLRPQIIDKAAALAGHGVAHFFDQEFAVGVFQRGQILAVELGFDRVPDHARMHIVQAVILFAGVTQIANRPLGLLLRSILCQHAGFHLFVVMVEHADGHLHHALQRGAAVVKHALVFGIQRQGADGHHPEHGGKQQNIQFVADTDSFQHGGVLVGARRLRASVAPPDDDHARPG